MHILPRRTKNIFNGDIKNLAGSLKSLEQNHSHQIKIVKNIRNVLKDFDAFLKKNKSKKEKNSDTKKQKYFGELSALFTEFLDQNTAIGVNTPDFIRTKSALTPNTSVTVNEIKRSLNLE